MTTKPSAKKGAARILVGHGFLFACLDFLELLGIDLNDRNRGGKEIAEGEAGDVAAFHFGHLDVRCDFFFEICHRGFHAAGAKAQSERCNGDWGDGFHNHDVAGVGYDGSRKF